MKLFVILSFLLVFNVAEAKTCKALFQKTTLEQVEDIYPEISEHPEWMKVFRLMISCDLQSTNSRFSGEPTLVQLSEQILTVAKSPLSKQNKNEAISKILSLYSFFELIQNTYFNQYEVKLFLKSLILHPASTRIMIKIGTQAARYDYLTATREVLTKRESELVELSHLDPQSKKFASALQVFLLQISVQVEVQIQDTKNGIRKLQRDTANKLKAKTKIEQQYKTIAETKNLAPAFRRQLDESFESLYNPRFAEILGKLTEYQWFMQQSPDKQFIIFYMLNGMVVKAYDSKDEKHQAVLTHTVNFIVNGYFPVLINSLHGVAGLAHLKFIEISTEEFAGLSASGPLNEKLSKKAADYLAHEVSHTISRQRVEDTYNYFVEEYRAFQVGHFAATGKLTTDREALSHAFKLITNKFNVSAYAYIANGFIRNFESNDYKYFFRLFGLDSVTIYEKIRSGHLTETLIQHYLNSVSDTQTAPQFGWPGFITNSPKPDSTDRYLQEVILGR